MNYEKAYKESLERARKLYEQGTITESLGHVFPELCESEDEIIRKALIRNFTNQHSSNFPTVDGFTREQILAWLEKQGKQKPIDKVEPKFKVGDWVVRDYLNNHTVNQVAEVKQIDDEHFGYTLDDEMYFSGSWESSYHLWTIQDANDGDVLYHKSPLTGIEYFVMSRGVNRCGNIDSYFRYNSEDGFGINIPSVLSGELDDITPATKEQRDFLFSKMKEAGYEWDSEKKELKKIEQKPSWSEEDEEKLNSIIEVLDDNSLLVQWLKSIKDRAQPHPKQEWSEEDEEYYMIVKESILERWKDTDNKDLIEIRDRALDWLKSLGDRVQSKPNQEWSEYDKIQLSEAIQMIEANGTWIRSEDAVKKVLNWLKSLRPQPKQEWSEEDKLMSQRCIADLEYFLKTDKPSLTNRYKEQIDWIRSLKPNHWKPSNKQLNEVKNAIGVTGTNGIVLLSLYNDLLKL